MTKERLESIKEMITEGEQDWGYLYDAIDDLLIYVEELEKQIR